MSNCQAPHLPASTPNDRGLPPQVIPRPSPCDQVHYTGTVLCPHPAPGCSQSIEITHLFLWVPTTPSPESTWLLAAESRGATHRWSTWPLGCPPFWNRAVEKQTNSVGGDGAEIPARFHPPHVDRSIIYGNHYYSQVELNEQLYLVYLVFSIQTCSNECCALHRDGDIC